MLNLDLIDQSQIFTNVYQLNVEDILDWEIGLPHNPLSLLLKEKGEGGERERER